MLLKNERDTQLFAQKLVKFSRGNNIVICLNGNLGSGKTTFSRYFIQEYLKDSKINIKILKLIILIFIDLTQPQS